MCQCGSEGNGLVVDLAALDLVTFDDLKSLFQPKNDFVILWMQNYLLSGWEGRLKATQQGRDKSENPVIKCCPENDLTTRGAISSSFVLKSRTEPWSPTNNTALELNSTGENEHGKTFAARWSHSVLEECIQICIKNQILILQMVSYYAGKPTVELVF